MLPSDNQWDDIIDAVQTLEGSTSVKKIVLEEGSEAVPTVTVYRTTGNIRIDIHQPKEH